MVVHLALRVNPSNSCHMQAKPKKLYELLFEFGWCKFCKQIYLLDPQINFKDFQFPSHCAILSLFSTNCKARLYFWKYSYCCTSQRNILNVYLHIILTQSSLHHFGYHLNANLAQSWILCVRSSAGIPLGLGLFYSILFLIYSDLIRFAGKFERSLVAWINQGLLVSKAYFLELKLLGYWSNFYLVSKQEQSNLNISLLQQHPPSAAFISNNVSKACFS